MIKWLHSFYQADPKTKFFVLTWTIFGLSLILSTLFVYSRLDYVRSDRAVREQQINTTPEEL